MEEDRDRENDESSLSATPVVDAVSPTPLALTFIAAAATTQRSCLLLIPWQVGAAGDEQVVAEQVAGARGGPSGDSASNMEPVNSAATLPPLTPL